MAAPRKMVGGSLKSYSGVSKWSLFPPTLFISCRGIASKLFVGAKVVMDRVSERSKGFGFVTLASDDEAEKALTEINGKTLEGRVIYVGYAKPKTRFRGGMLIARGSPASEADKVKLDFFD